MNSDGNKPKRKSRQWMVWEDKYILEHYKNMPRPEMADALQRTEGAVRARMFALGLGTGDGSKQKRDERGWREETNCTSVCICSAVYRGQKLKDIAEDLNRPLSQVEFVYNRSLKDGTYNRVKMNIENPPEKSGGSSGIASICVRGRRAAISD